MYLYPLNPESLRKENNSYVRQLVAHLGHDFTIVNRSTKRGLLDALTKFSKTDIYYFNWIENLPTNRFGHLQVGLLAGLLLLCKLSNKKVVWFVHNNIAHSKKHYQIRKIIVRLMASFADLVLSHSSEITVPVPKEKLHIFHHPLEVYQPLPAVEPFAYDLLIWGAVLPYKGVAEFIEFAANSPHMADYKIMIAGKFQSAEYYDRCAQHKSGNVSLVNGFIDEEELIALFAQSKYVLFTYASPSVLSSAALCKSLSFGKAVIAPNVGSFKELGKEGLIHTYNSFPELEILLDELAKNRRAEVNMEALEEYAGTTTWESFSSFVSKCIHQLYAKPLATYTVRAVN